MTSHSVLSNNSVSKGLSRFVLKLDVLYPSGIDRERFESRWLEFYESDEDNPRIFKKWGDRLQYLSESWIPIKKDSRPPLLLLFGNPAPHSVLAGMYFAYEGAGREHRVWRIFRETSLLNWKNNFFKDNDELRDDFYNLNYKSPFRLAMEVFYSMPSAPSNPQWSGVNGLFKLFGKKAMKIIQEEEQSRIKLVIKNFLTNKGSIIAFQKDAYNGVKDERDFNYSLQAALTGRLTAGCKFSTKIKVLGVPPTRFLQGQKAKMVLQNFIIKLKNN